jgi:Arc/MetJ-type ribon-helix-helix transcriptional regulator
LQYVTIHLPSDLEDSLQAEVSNGHFASLDDAMAEAVRLLLRDRTQRQPEARTNTGVGSIGAMSDAADELDEIVADAYRRRQEEPWRDIAVE